MTEFPSLLLCLFSCFVALGTCGRDVGPLPIRGFEQVGDLAEVVVVGMAFDGGNA